MIKIKQGDVIDENDWNKLVSKTYNKIYRLQQQDGCKERGVVTIYTSEDYIKDFKNVTVPEIINGEIMGISFKTWLKKDINKSLNPSIQEARNCGYYFGKTEEDFISWKKNKNNIILFWERNFYPHISVIANDLYKRGILKEGKYNINIYW